MQNELSLYDDRHAGVAVARMPLLVRYLTPRDEHDPSCHEGDPDQALGGNGISEQPPAGQRRQGEPPADKGVCLRKLYPFEDVKPNQSADAIESQPDDHSWG